MRSSSEPRYNTTNIAESTSLSIAMYIEPKPKKKTRPYRPVQRPDGVVVEYPRYRRHTTPKPHFEPKLLLLKDQVPNGKPTDPRRNGVEEDVRGVGAFEVELRKLGGRDGYNAPVELGRDGYNEPAKMNMTPMERFMGEPGPWTPYSASLLSGR